MTKIEWLSIIFSVNYMLFLSECFANDTFQYCSNVEIYNIIQQQKLTIKLDQFSQQNSFSNIACIKRSDASQTIFAYSKAIYEDEIDSATNYTLDLFILNAKNKMISKYKNTDFADSGGLNYEGIKFDLTPFQH